MAIDILNSYSSVPPLSGRTFTGKIPDSLSNDSQSGALSFQNILRQKTEEPAHLRFSKHANERMLQRNLDLTEDQRQRLESGVMKAGQKGIRESLVMVDDMAFIVNVNNNTVITAVGENDDKVFTNIDGAVIA